MTRLLSLAAALSIIALAGAAPARADAMFFGPGLSTCDQIMSLMSAPGVETAADAWILGYWSALNSENATSVGENLAPRGILTAVWTACRQPTNRYHSLVVTIEHVFTATMFAGN